MVDAANGAASHIAGDVFDRAGAQVVVINASPDGRNINAGCGATDPAGLQAAVTAERAHAGIALDGDADRLIAVDERGDVVDGDHVIAICASDMRRARPAPRRHRGRDGDGQPRLPHRHARRRDRVVETDVGDRYVLEALLAGGYSLGGEQSGHVIFPDHATTGDGMLTALVAARRRPTLGQAALAARRGGDDAAPAGARQHRGRRAPRPDVAELLADDIAEAAAALGETGRILVRASGTEPLIRVMVEAPTRELAQSTADELGRARARAPRARAAPAVQLPDVEASSVG